MPDFTLSPALPAGCADPLVYSSVVINNGGKDDSWITESKSGKGITL